MSKKEYVKVELPANPVKPWWPGDNRVEKYMPKVREAIGRHITDKSANTDIYNRAYEAIYAAIIDYDKDNEKAVNDMAESFESILKDANVYTIDLELKILRHYEHLRKRLHEPFKQLQAKVKRLEEENRWIPVSKKLPKEEGIYLTKYKGDGRQRLNEKMWIRSYPFWGIFKDNWIYKKQTKYCITHWKPIVLPRDTNAKS